VSGIEAGTMDARVTMLTRVLAAAGYRLGLSFEPIAPAPRLADLTGARIEDFPDWVKLRFLIDWAFSTPAASPR
jgi:hypothetical protein